MEYLILRNIKQKNPAIEIDCNGFADTFTTYKAAKDFAVKHGVENYVIVAVCDDQKNYLV
jgi:thiamine biosynthesis lipoprotein ApbE